MIPRLGDGNRNHLHKDGLEFDGLENDSPSRGRKLGMRAKEP